MPVKSRPPTPTLASNRLFVAAFHAAYCARVFLPLEMTEGERQEAFEVGLAALLSAVRGLSRRYWSIGYRQPLRAGYGEIQWEGVPRQRYVWSEPSGRWLFNDEVYRTWTPLLKDQAQIGLVVPNAKPVSGHEFQSAYGVFLRSLWGMPCIWN